MIKVDRAEMIKSLIKSAIHANFNKPLTTEELKDYKEYLESKTDLELQNLIMINC